MQKETSNKPELESSSKEKSAGATRLSRSNQHAATAEHQSLYSGNLLSRVWRWTGFGDKTLWDFLQLLVAPVALIIAGVAIQEFVEQRDQRRDDDQAKQEMFFGYLDDMAEAIGNGLLKATPGSDPFIIAQARTVTALSVLDSERQGSVIQFLQAANLYNPAAPKHGLLYQARMFKADLSQLDLRDADLYKVDIREGDLNQVKLSRSILIGANLEGANLSETALDGTDFRWANLRNANLQGAHTQGTNIPTDFQSADLGKADLSNANLHWANFLGANLSETDLSNADLLGAKLGEITGANLSGTVLTASDVTDTALSSALLCKTVLPESSQLNPNRDCLGGT